MWKRILHTLFWLAILTLMVLPFFLIYKISQSEMAAFAQDEAPTIRQCSIGKPVQASRTDLSLYETVSGRFTSHEKAFMDLAYKDPEAIRWIVSFGDEINIGQVIGYYKGEEILSEVEGIIENICISITDAYILVRRFEPLLLECDVADSVLENLMLFQNSLSLKTGEEVTMQSVVKVKNADGSTRIYLQIHRDGDCYGAVLQELRIYLGTSYPGVLVLPKECVYQKHKGDDEPWYAYQVTEDGFAIGEKQVRITYANDSFVVVSGIADGEWYDSGYHAITDGTTS